MRHILILDTGKEWGGGTNSLIELLKRVDRKKYCFTALFYYNYKKGNESDIKTEIEKLRIKFILIPQKSQSITIKILKEIIRTLFFFNKKLRKYAIFWIDYFYRIKPNSKKIAKILKDFKIDMLYMNNQPSSNLEGIIASKITGIPVIQHCRIEPRLNPYEVKAINLWINKIICVSDGVKNKLIEQGIKIDKCVVVYNGIDIKITPGLSKQEIRKKLGISEREILLGSVGSLIRRKNFDILIDALYIVKKNTNYELKCVVVGDGPEREKLSNLVKIKNLESNFIFIGFQIDAISYINSFDIFVMTSEQEGLPRVILEAMLMAKPVVASNITGCSDLVVDGETGFLVSPKNPYAFAEKILLLIKNPEMRKQMGEKGRKRVIENFSIEKYIEGVEKVFGEVLKA